MYVCQYNICVEEAEKYFGCGDDDIGGLITNIFFCYYLETVYA